MPFGTALHAAKTFSCVMTNNSNAEPAAFPQKAGYSPKSSIPDLASAWLIYCRDPDSQANRDHLARNLDQIFKSRLPNGRYDGTMKGREADVRQEAYLLLVSNYLPGNEELFAATETGNIPEISNQIEKSLNGSIRSTFQTLRKSILRHLQFHAYGDDPDATAQGTCQHPAHRTTMWDLPYETQRELVFASLHLAVREKHLKPHHAAVAIAMVDQGMSQQQMATELGVSRQAIHQRLQPVREFLEAHIETLEFPQA